MDTTNFDTLKDDIKTYIDKYEEVLTNNLLNAVISGIEEHYLEKKNKLEYIYISFLRSSIYDNHRYFRIDFYDIQQYRDLYGYNSFWDVSDVQKLIDNIVFTSETSRSAYLKSSIDAEQMKIALAEHFFQCINENIGSLVQPTIDYMQKNMVFGVKIYFGEYLDNSTHIATTLVEDD